MIIKRGVVYGPGRPRPESMPKYLWRLLTLIAKFCWFLVKLPFAGGSGFDNKTVIKE